MTVRHGLGTWFRRHTEVHGGHDWAWLAAMITAVVLCLAVTPGLAEAGVDASGQFTTDVAVNVQG
jgi:hypothetical protein